MKKVLLLLFSLIIYAYFGIKSIIFIAFSAISTFFAAKYFNNKNSKKKLVLILTLITNITILVFFKTINYYDFNIKNVFIPLGISYYTFQVLGYLIDVYKNKYPAEKSFIKYLLFVFYIPYLFIGPINRYDKLKDSLYNNDKIQGDDFINGLLRISLGLLKKFLIAQRIAVIVNTITSNPTTYDGAYVFLAVILYSFELYSDFSGGIDIVLGFSNILGIHHIENFNTPYLSQNLKEFWRRWHISLSSWFRDYVYIPLGGNRCSFLRNKINIVITFVISGIWHGINYFFWGLFHGLIVAFTPKENSDFKVINIIINFIIVSLLWIFFIYPDSLTAFSMLASMFLKYNGIELFKNFLKLGLDIPNLIIMVVSIIGLIIFDIKNTAIKEKVLKLSYDKKLIIILTIVLITLLFGVYGIGFEKSNFIYGKF